jgi:hypothetical protein
VSAMQSGASKQVLRRLARSALLMPSAISSRKKKVLERLGASRRIDAAADVMMVHRAGTNRSILREPGRRAPPTFERLHCPVGARHGIDVDREGSGD